MALRWRWARTNGCCCPTPIRCLPDAADPGVAVIDASSAQWVVRLAGTAALGLLRSGCGIDLRPTRFPIDDFAQTRLGPFAVLLHRVGEATYDLHVERSLRDALDTWLACSADILEATGTPS